MQTNQSQHLCFVSLITLILVYIQRLGFVDSNSFAMQVYCELLNFVPLILGFVICSGADVQTYVVYPEETCQHTNDTNECLTLSDVFSERDKYLTSNSTLVIQEGEHILQGEAFSLFSISNFTLQGINGSLFEPSSSNITCNNSFFFLSDVSIRIVSINFNYCNFSMSFSDVLVQDSRFENGRADSGGALSRVTSVVQFDGANRFAGNYAYGFGGAIYANWSMLVFSGSTSFAQNNAQRGGAVYCANSSLSFSGNSAFLSNGGGAVHARDNNTMSFYGNSTFMSNTANSDFGGAVYAWDSNILIFNGNSCFISNTAVLGGAVYTSTDNTFNFNGNVSFISNEALGGGAVHTVSNNTLWFNGNSSFIYNSASQEGAAIRALRDNTFSFTGSSSFVSSTAGLNGGAVYFRFTNTLSFDGNTSFIKNTANRNGGAVYVESSNLSFSGNTTFIENTATWYGGAVYVDGDEVRFNDNIGFIENRANRNGGAVFVGSSILSFTCNGNISFIKNTATWSGGAVYVEGNNVSFNEKTSFIENTAIYVNGGAVYAESSNLSFSGNTSFIKNTARHYGGAVCLWDSNSLSFNGSISIISNTAEIGGAVNAGNHNTLIFNGNISVTSNEALSGGALHIFSSNMVSFNGNSSFMHNSARQEGAVVRALRDNTFSFNGSSTFVSSTAGLNGGAVYCRFTNTLSFDGNTSFTRNTANLDGSAVYLGSGTLCFDGNTSFIKNLAYRNGGAVYVGSSNLSFNGHTSFIGNAAIWYGGAMYVDGDYVWLEGENIGFIENRANRNGGALFVGTSILNCACNGNIRFIKNAATWYGGAVYIEGDNVSFNENTSFIENTAVLNGGAVYAESSNMSFSGNTSFIKNTARSYYGGAVYLWDNTSLSFNGNIGFVKNTAVLGGAVSIWTHNTLSINGDISFISNEALGGGALHTWSSNTVWFNGNSSFIHNLALQEGAAIRALRDNTFSFTGSSSFVSSTAGLNGGAVYFRFANTLSFDGNTSFTGNTANLNGGAVYVASSILSFYGETSFVKNSAELDGGAVYVESSVLNFHGSCALGHNKAMRGGGIALLSNSLLQLSGKTSLLSNNATFGGGAFIQDSNINSTENMIIERNDALHGGGLFIQSSVFTLQGTGILAENTVTDPEGGYGGAIFARSSIVEFQGSFDVTNNTAGFGGGMAFFGIYDGVLVIKNVTTLSFEGNLARRRGGAVYVDDDPFTFCTPDQTSPNHELCFFQTRNAPYDCFAYRDSSFTYQATDIIMEFVNNVANVSGDDMYGGHLDSCIVCTVFPVDHAYTNGSETFHHFTESDSGGLLTLSSDPYKVCICEDSQPNCDLREVTHYVYPGQVLAISLVAVGLMDGIVPSVIRAVSDNHVGTSNFLETQPAENIKECSQLRYPLFSTLLNTSMKLYSDEPCSTSGFPLTFLFHFFACPVGFTLSEDGACICDDRLQKYTQSCNIEDLSINRDAGDSFWVGAENKERLILHPHCPFDYCIEEAAYFTLNSTDLQCTNGRSGVLCGVCRPGHSLALGSSRCLSDCSNRFLALLLAFAFAGIILVAFLFLCRLTLAEGTLSGLIFYANILVINQTVFFPSGERNLLTVFIAWLNLDLGIETCFFVGLDAYYKTWLQFAFPIYIWLMVGGIIVLADRSVLFAKVIGSTNPVAVLASLFLLSYTKFLRTIMAAFSFTTLDYPEGDNSYVWLYDGNVGYMDRLDGRHIGLFLFSLLFLLFIFLPYTLLLLCGQWIQKHLWWLSSAKQLYLKYFLDAHYAPYKKRHHYWTGLLFLIRFLILFVATMININNPQDPSSNLLTILIVASSLILWGWFVRGIYKKWYHDILEGSFIFNLVVLAGGTYQVRQSGGNQAALVYTSVSIAFMTFIGIVLSAVVKRVKEKVDQRRRRVARCKTSNSPDHENDSVHHVPAARLASRATFSSLEIVRHYPDQTTGEIELRTSMSEIPDSTS